MWRIYSNPDSHGIMEVGKIRNNLLIKVDIIYIFFLHGLSVTLEAQALLCEIRKNVTVHSKHADTHRPRSRIFH
jgi:hypothetical protein